jgi:propionyl-CoA synthetase
VSSRGSPTRRLPRARWSTSAPSVAGHRLSTASIESVVAADRAVAECAVIGVPDNLKGQVPVAWWFCATKPVPSPSPNSWTPKSARRSAQSPPLKRVVAVTALPKTRSGKIVRKALREAIAGRPFSTGTIEDLTVLESCLEALRWV